MSGSTDEVPWEGCVFFWIRYWTAVSLVKQDWCTKSSWAGNHLVHNLEAFVRLRHHGRWLLPFNVCHWGIESVPNRNRAKNPEKNEAFCGCESSWEWMSLPKNDWSAIYLDIWAEKLSFVFYWLSIGSVGAFKFCAGIHVRMSAFQIKAGNAMSEETLPSDTLIDQCRMAGADNV